MTFTAMVRRRLRRTQVTIGKKKKPSR